MGATMNTKEILTSTRVDKLDDVKGYGKGYELWKDEELLRHLNFVLNEWCRQTLCLRDSSTEAICKISLLANQYIFPMDSRIVALHKGRLLSGWPNIEIKDELWLDDNIFSWETRVGEPRYLVPDYEAAKLRIVPYFNTDGYFSGAMTFSLADKSITKAGANFSTYLSVGNQVVISGTTSNLGTKTVVTATADAFTVSEAVTDETPSAAIIQKVRDTLWLSTSRLPLVQLTLAAWETLSPEINFDYHPKLIDGILREAYLKQDTECYDPKAADRHRILFETSKVLGKKEKYRLRHSSRVLRPHPGAM
jgi:hypothetical protein